MKISQKLFLHIKKIEVIANKLASDLLVGAYRSAFKGRGIEFHEVREYVAGDDLRCIDWNVTARMRVPYIKNFKEDRQLTVMLAIDVSASSRCGSLKQRKSDLIAEIAALISLTAMKNDDRIGLLLFSDEVELYLPPKKGVKHVLRVIRELLVFRPKARGSNLKAALDYLGRVHKRRCICFLISDFIFPLCFDQLAVLAKRHDLISLHIVDQAEENFPQIGLVSACDSENLKIKMVDTSDKKVREKLLSSLKKRKADVKEVMQKIGAGLIVLHTNAPYVDKIRKFFRLRRIRH